jgi:hypothetical protein
MNPWEQFMNFLRSEKAEAMRLSLPVLCRQGRTPGLKGNPAKIYFEVERTRAKRELQPVEHLSLLRAALIKRARWPARHNFFRGPHIQGFCRHLRNSFTLNRNIVLSRVLEMQASSAVQF